MTEPTTPAVPFEPATVRPRHDGWTPDKQRAFLEHLADTGCVSRSAEAVGMSAQSAYALRRRQPASIFAYGWDSAIQLSRPRLHDAAVERALAGTVIPIFYRGEQVGERVVHDNKLLTFLLAQGERFDRVARPVDEIIQLWPLMLDAIDRAGPPPIDPAMLAGLAKGEEEPGKRGTPRQPTAGDSARS